MKQYDIENASRIVAYLIVDGKAYASDCDHQDCLEMYYHDKGIKSEFDWSDADKFDETQKKAAKKTYEMKNSHLAYGFDLFDTDMGFLLVAHDEETYNANLRWANDEARHQNAACGFFTSGTKVILVA